jgi:hypothetical protein
MDHQTNVASAERRTRKEIRQIVAEFATSGLQQIEFCRSRGDLTKYSRSSSEKTTCPGSRKQGRQSLVGGRDKESELELSEQQQRVGGGINERRRIEVNRGFDRATLERLLTVLDKG